MMRRISKDPIMYFMRKDGCIFFVFIYVEIISFGDKIPTLLAY